MEGRTTPIATTNSGTAPVYQSVKSRGKKHLKATCGQQTFVQAAPATRQGHTVDLCKLCGHLEDSDEWDHQYWRTPRGKKVHCIKCRQVLLAVLVNVSPTQVPEEQRCKLCWKSERSVGAVRRVQRQRPVAINPLLGDFPRPEQPSRKRPRDWQDEITDSDSSDSESEEEDLYYCIPKSRIYHLNRQCKSIASRSDSQLACYDEEPENKRCCKKCLKYNS